MPLQVSALQILPSSQSENYEYPPSWKFKIFPDKSLKKVSSQVECHLNITAGTVKLVQERFNHTHPNQCKLYLVCFMCSTYVCMYVILYRGGSFNG